jgi:hypothetical protein
MCVKDLRDFQHPTFRISEEDTLSRRGTRDIPKVLNGSVGGNRCIFLTVRLPEWNFGLVLLIRRNMVFVSYIHVLSAAFLMGLAAAAPRGPVNMLAIRRGVIDGWRHTLAYRIGSVTGDLILFSLVLLRGQYLFSDLSHPTLQTVLDAALLSGPSFLRRPREAVDIDLAIHVEAV